MLALLSFGDPGLAQRGLALLLDPAFDVRESWTALGAASEWSPERRAPHDFIVANFDALAKSVSPYAPAHWPAYAQALCSSRDRAAVEAFWRPRLARYEGAERELAMALEAIDVCRRLRPGASERPELPAEVHASPGAPSPVSPRCRAPCLTLLLARGRGIGGRTLLFAARPPPGDAFEGTLP
jgi:hypothetical protein